MNFNDFLGNDKNIKYIKQLIMNGSFPHTILFEGIAGSGKFSLARASAKALLCEDKDYVTGFGSACGKCASCRKAEAGTHPDLAVLDSKSDLYKNYSKSKSTKFIHIDEVREFTENLYLQPNDGDKKVFIIKNAHELTVQAQNSILKALEEPPLFAVFFLTAESRGALLDTIVSRSVVISADLPSDDKIIEYFEKKEYGGDHEKLRLAARLSGGSVGGTEKILAEGFLEKNKPAFLSCIDALVGKTDGVYKIIYNNEYSRDELLSFYSYFGFIIRDIMLLFIFGETDYYMHNDGESSLRLDQLSFYNEADYKRKIDDSLPKIPFSRLVSAYKNLIKSQSELSFNPNARLNLTNFIANIY